MRAIQVLLAAAVLGGVLFATEAALGARAGAMPKGGAIRVYVVPGKTQGNGTVLVVGAIGDYGKSSGKTANGIGTVKLQKGTFEVNLNAISKAMNNAHPTVFNTTSCTYVFGASAPAAITDGTGAYKGISGTITITETFAGYGPFYTSGAHKGKCNTSSNATPTAQWGSVSGVGTVKFS
jgi:hypothetical protein